MRMGEKKAQNEDVRQRRGQEVTRRDEMFFKLLFFFIRVMFFFILLGAGVRRGIQ